MLRISLPISLLTIAISSAPTNAQAQSWQFIEAWEDLSTAMLADTSSIKREVNDRATASILMVQRDDQRAGDVTFAALLARYEYDCAAHRQRGLQIAFYDASGKQVHAEGEDDDWNPIPAGTIFSAAEAYVCSGELLANVPSFNGTMPIKEVRDYLLELSRAK